MKVLQVRNMNKDFKDYATDIAESLRYLNGRFIERTKPVSQRSMGVNPKRCKSCKDFKHCNMALNRKQMDAACREYKKRK